MRGAGNGKVINTLDVGRGLAIVCVLYGHALAPWFMGADPFYQPAFLQWKFGASFMMALFFFLSGAGWREHRSLETTIRQAMALVLIAWLTSVMLDLVYFVVGFSGIAAPLGLEPLSLERLVRNAARMAVFGDAYSMSALWFLVALAVVRVIAALSYRLGVLPAWALAFAFLGATLAATEFSWRNVYQIGAVGIALVCFLAGHALRNGVRRLEEAPHAALALCVVAGAATVLSFDLNQGCRWDWSANCGQGWLGGGFGVAMVNGQYGNLFWFAFTTATGIAFATSLCLVLVRAAPALAERVGVWGRQSIDLLIVNCIQLHLATPLVAFFIAPRLQADNLWFFLGLFAATLAANLVLAALMRRPLRKLRAFAAWSAGAAIAFIRASGALAFRRDGVSRANER